MERVLVTGGAGYIGSHVVRWLRDRGWDPVVLDDLRAGHAAAVEGARLVRGDCGDESLLERVLGGRDVPWIVHLAASCEVAESVADPGAYYRNNVGSSLRLLDAAVRHRVRGVVFSSTAAVYGEPQALPIEEDHPRVPTNPYGETKRVIEDALAWYRRAHGTSYVVLRYFNAAGAHPDGTIGEHHAGESHLLPRLLLRLLHGGEPVPIHGTDYPTPDGTCVRDYVHVADLATAHGLALELLAGEGGAGEIFNLGNGAGYSVREVVGAVERVTGSAPTTLDAPRRPGDPARLVASAERFRCRTGWVPEHAALDRIVETAWRWHRSHPHGYGG